jgi:hypothetical protein
LLAAHEELKSTFTLKMFNFMISTNVEKLIYVAYSSRERIVTDFAHKNLFRARLVWGISETGLLGLR